MKQTKFGTYSDCATMRDVLKHVDLDTLVLCDLDNTLFRPESYLGSVPWGENQIKQYMAAGMSHLEAYHKGAELWKRLQVSLPMRLVEECSLEVVRHLQDSGIPFYPLTAREINEQEYTEKHLSHCGITVKIHHAEWPRRLEFEHLPLAGFADGILYTSDLIKKADLLRSFFEAVKYQPKKVVYIDDKWHHVHNLGDFFTELEVPHVCLRYNAADEWCAQFDPEIAAIQMEHFPKIISNEEASQFKRYTKVTL